MSGSTAPLGCASNVSAAEGAQARVPVLLKYRCDDFEFSHTPAANGKCADRIRRVRSRRNNKIYLAGKIGALDVPRRRNIFAAGMRMVETHVRQPFVAHVPKKSKQLPRGNFISCGAAQRVFRGKNRGDQ